MFGFGSYKYGSKEFDNSFFDAIKGYRAEGKTPPKEFIEMVNQRASERLIEEHIPQISNATKQAFYQANLQDKARILRHYAKDTDDIIWRSKEWMALEEALYEG